MSIAAHGHGDAFFPLPEPLIQGPATRVMSLRDGAKKMSKSDPSENAYIALTDDADTIAQKIRKAKTDPEPLPSEVEGLGPAPRGGQSRRHFRRADRRDQGRRAPALRRQPVFGVQDALADVTIEKLAPIRAEMLRLSADPAFVDSVLADGADKARAMARPNMDAIKDILGLVR